jgi:peptide deformylase
MKLPLVYYGNPILRKKAIEVEEITDEIQTLIDEMLVTMKEARGIGLAAPQVGFGIRLFITQVPVPSKEDPEEEVEGPFLVFINPKLSQPSEEKWDYYEGCLSIPTVHAYVTRPYAIHVEATDRHGNPFEADYTGLQARCIMHENDHINGVLFIDRLTKEQRKEIEGDLEKMKKGGPWKQHRDL